MSQNSNSKYGDQDLRDPRENEYNNNYGDTFKHGRESSSTPNVFNQNLGGTVSYSTYGYSHYNNVIDIEKRDYIREVVNKEDGERRLSTVERDNVNNVDEAENEENVKNLEIFEDQNNHIEELADDFNIRAGIDGSARENIENNNEYDNQDNYVEN